MKKLFLILIFLLLGFNQAAVQVGELVANGKFYDMKIVEIQGEVIGVAMTRGKQTWLNILTADGNAIGVLCSNVLAAQVKIFGDYKNRGDQVLVTGVFERFAPSQTGETMITARELKIVRPGYPVRHALSENKVYVTIFIWLFILILSYKNIYRTIKYFRLLRERTQRG